MYSSFQRNYNGRELEDEEDMLEVAVMIAFPVRQRIIRERPDHFVRWSEQGFMDRFRVSKTTANFLLLQIEQNIATLTTRNHACSPAHQLLLTLRYYATGSFLSVCGDFMGVHKSTASRIVRKVSHEIALLRPVFINFPESEDEINLVKQDFCNIANFPKCVGAIDCTHIRIKSPGGKNAEIFRNRKGYFSFNVQTICDADLRIQDIVCRWPGSSHDSTIFNNSNIKERFERREFGDSILVGDSGYGLKPYLMTPFRDVNTDGENRYNEYQTRTRNPVERSYGVWKRRFPVLAIGINLNIRRVESVVVATAVIHNIARHFGDSIPRITRAIERLIDIGNVDGLNDNDNDEEESGAAKRASFVRYFESL